MDGIGWNPSSLAGNDGLEVQKYTWKKKMAFKILLCKAKFHITYMLCSGRLNKNCTVTASLIMLRSVQYAN